MSVAMKLAYKRDINDPLVTFCPETLLMRGDREANVIELTVMDGSSPADLSGYTVVVMFQRPGDSDKIRCPGSISGNVISVPLLADCYAYSGQYYASLILNASGFTRTMLRLAGQVENNGDGPVIDPTGTIPGYEDIARIYAELEASLEESESATSSANAAAQNANREAEAANLAASNANNKAGVADAAAENANAAAELIENMTVSATDVAYDQNATATVTDVNGHKHIAFGLRQGIPGDVPTITFSVETGEPGTNVQVEQSGAPDAPTVTLTIPRGDPGEGAVSSVDGLMPGIGGDVALGAVRYVSQTLEDLQKQQARENIGALGSDDVANDLGVVDAGKVLDARQGRELNERISDKASTASYTATFTAAGWSASAPYTQTVNVAGMLATDDPFVDVSLSGASGTEATNRMEAWTCVGRVTANAGSVTAYCYDEKPTVNLPVILKVVR